LITSSFFQHFVWAAVGEGSNTIQHVDSICQVRDHLHVVLNPDDANSKIISAFENEVGKILAFVA